MKKFLAFVLLFIYAVVSTGFVVSVHYCMDEMAGVQFGDVVRDKCGKCGMPLKENRNCCKDDVKVYRLQVDQAFAKLPTADFSLAAVVPAPIQISASALLTESSKAAPVAHGPPLSKQGIYLRNRVFRL